MLKKRVIAVLLIKDGYVVKTTRFNRPQRVGQLPYQLERYAKWDLDELVILDISQVAPTQRVEHESKTMALLERCIPMCPMPLSIGGNIHQLSQVHQRIHLGAEKIVLNQAVFETPDLVTQAAQSLGSQSVTVGLDVRYQEHQFWVCDRKRNRLIDLETHLQWVSDLGPGELFVNFIDNDGTYNGYTTEVAASIANQVRMPVVICGGAKNWVDIDALFKSTAVSAAALSNQLLFQELSYVHLRSQMASQPSLYQGA